MRNDQYLREFAANLAGEFNRLPLRMPAEVRRAMERAIQSDDLAQQWEAQRDKLENLVQDTGSHP